MTDAKDPKAKHNAAFERAWKSFDVMASAPAVEQRRAIYASLVVYLPRLPEMDRRLRDIENMLRDIQKRVAPKPRIRAKVKAED